MIDPCTMTDDDLDFEYMDDAEEPHMRLLILR